MYFLDTGHVFYSQAEDMEVDVEQFPMGILLRTDVPQLPEFLNRQKRRPEEELCQLAEEQQDSKLRWSGEEEKEEEECGVEPSRQLEEGGEIDNWMNRIGD